MSDGPVGATTAMRAGRRPPETTGGTRRPDNPTGDATTAMRRPSRRATRAPETTGGTPRARLDDPTTAVRADHRATGTPEMTGGTHRRPDNPTSDATTAMRPGRGGARPGPASDGDNGPAPAESRRTPPGAGRGPVPPRSAAETAVVPAASPRRGQEGPARDDRAEHDLGGPEPAATIRVPARSSGPQGSVAPDRSERAELARRRERENSPDVRASRIDETLTRLTAAHAGLALARPDEDDDDDPPPARRRIRLTPGRVLAAALAVVVVLTTAFGWSTKSWLGSAIGDAAALDPESGAIVDGDEQAGDENVLVVATEPGAADPAVPRADTVAVAHIPAAGGPVTVLSFPNDLEINRPPCARWDPVAGTYQEDKPVRAEARTQLASALDDGGPRCVTRVVQQLSGLAVTKYVGMDLSAVRAMADAVGGVDVCVPRPVLDSALGPVVPDAGTSHIEGVKAADFVRAGEVQGDPSPDYGRIERQQQLLAAVLDKAVSGTSLLDVGQLAALRPALSKAVVADSAGLDELLALSLTLRNLGADGVRYAAVPTGDANNGGHTALRDTDAAALFAAVRADGPLPEQASDPNAANGPTPGDVTVQVLNGSDRSGLAGEVGETLRSLGFGVGDVDTAEQPTPQTVIRFSPDQAAAAALLSATVPSATSVPDPGTSDVLQLVLGRSFDDVVRAPSEPIALQSAAAPSPGAAEATCS